MIMEDSPEPIRSISDTKLGNKRGWLPQPSGARVIAERMGRMQTQMSNQFDDIAVQIKDGQARQNRLSSAADTLARSMKDAMRAIQLSQSKHETAIQQNDRQLQTLLHHNADLASKILNWSNGQWD